MKQLRNKNHAGKLKKNTSCTYLQQLGMFIFRCQWLWLILIITRYCSKPSRITGKTPLHIECWHSNQYQSSLSVDFGKPFLWQRSAKQTSHDMDKYLDPCITMGCDCSSMLYPNDRVNILRPWQMDAISQTTFSNVFSWMKMFEFRLKFHWSLFPRVQLTIFQQWFR